VNIFQGDKVGFKFEKQRVNIVENEQKMEIRYQELIQQINEHNDHYYNEDAPEITDFEYDQLTQELSKIERIHPEWIKVSSPSQKVGGKAKRQAGVLVPHQVPMLSLQDVFSKEAVVEFVEEIKKQLDHPEFVVERKIDGLSMSLRYENRVLVQATTRGDGVFFGEDVTLNARVIQGMVEKFEDEIEKLEVRCEVYMTEESFQKVNERQELLEKKLFANPRNCAAGTLRQLDSKITKERNLNIFVFNIQQIQGREIKSHTEGYDLLVKLGFPIIEEFEVCQSAQEVWDAIERIGQERGSFGYNIDGAVVKINSYEQREQLGATTKVPRWAVAYKYPPEEKETVLLDIVCSVGRTGRITPTAVFEPIHLCGTTVARATLHNQDFMDELDIRIGDTIVVYKSGDIIPKVKEVIKEKRPETSQSFSLPAFCPACGEPTVRSLDSADLKCISLNCPAQLEQHLIHFVGRDAMDIKGFGASYIESLVAEKYLTNIKDIYLLKDHKQELIDKGIIGKDKNTEKLLQMIEESKKNEPFRLLTGLGIPNVGKATGKALMNYFLTMDRLQVATQEELREVPDVGEISALEIFQYFRNETTIQLIEKLKELGLNMVQKEIKGTVFNGVTFVVTGTFETFERKEIQEKIEQMGGKVSSSVSKKTNYVLAGEQAGSKLTKAKELGIRIIEEKEFIEMLENSKLL